mgnify:CR=1 FL=1
MVALLHQMLPERWQKEFSPVVMVPVYRAGGSGSIPGRTNTLGLKIIEEKLLPLL